MRYSEVSRAIGWGPALHRVGACGAAIIGILALADGAWGSLGGIAGYAGAPGDPSSGVSRTCLQCHTPPAIPVTGTLTVEVPEQVETGELVDITVLFEGDPVAKWGFNLIAVVDEPNGQPTGTLVAGAGSQIMTSSVFWDYLSHAPPFGSLNLVNDVPGWSAQWLAPEEEFGSIRFYAAFNAADGGTAPFFNTGDQIFTAEAVVEVVPEPGLAGAAAVSLAALAALRRRRRV